MRALGPLGAAGWAAPLSPGHDVDARPIAAAASGMRPRARPERLRAIVLVSIRAGQPARGLRFGGDARVRALPARRCDDRGLRT